MKPVSVHVATKTYQEIKSLAARQGRPVAELIREAMAEYVVRRKRSERSLRDIPAHPSGSLRKSWTRGEILEEMIRR